MIPVLGALFVFAQLSLHDAQSDALVASPDVASARAKVAEAQARFDEARATLGPALTANYNQVPQAGPTNTSVVTQRLTTVGAQWSLGDLFAYSPAVAQATAALRAAQRDLDDAERGERVAVVGAYYAALGARATLRARDDELSAAQAQLRAARLRFGAGDAPRLDVVRATVAVATAQSDEARAQADVENTDAALALETGVDSGALQTMTPVNLEAPPLNLAVQDAAARALASRPDVAAARENVVAEQHAVGVARRSGWPLVTLAGGYTTGVDTGIPVSGPSGTVDVSLPLSGAAHDRVREEEARLAQARAQLQKVERSVQLEVGAAVRDYRAQTIALAASEDALQSAQAAFRAAQIGYRSGALASLELESARSAYVQALVTQISALYAQARARATLSLLLGEADA
ncbi:MAG: TolC family protein [Candidatus Eremiobacteraeota bacterium]|nr:TolC family protein [Candidatus Eremiobacteraeota bacterium]MBV8499650.1 TolC family protein [Candidatus Eremiobacteraeota bacterium]